MFKKCLENRIISLEEDYKCYVCHDEIKQSFDLVEEHLDTDSHKENLSDVDEKQRQNESDKLVDMSEAQLQKLVENWIIFDRCFVASFYCIVCKCTINESADTFVHIEEVSHRLALRKLILERKINMTKKLSDNNNIPTQELVGQPLSFQPLVYGLQLETNCVAYDGRNNSYHCNICKTTNIAVLNLYEHIQGYNHQAMLAVKNLLLIDENTSQDLANQVIVQTHNIFESQMENTILQKESCFTEIYCCDICKAYLRDNADAQCHIMFHLFEEFTVLNNFDLLEFKIGDNGRCYIKCLLCDYSCHARMSDGHEYLKEHFRTIIHQERLTFFKCTKNDLGLEEMDEKINSLDYNQFTYSAAHSMVSCQLCNKCNVPLPLPNENRDEHVLGKCQEKKSQKIVNGAIMKKKLGFDKEDPNFYKCFICNLRFFDGLALFDHYKTSEHKWKIEGLKIIKTCTYTYFRKSNDAEILNCSLCNILFNDFKSAIEHIVGEKHNNNLKLMAINQEYMKSKIGAPVFQAPLKVSNKMKQVNTFETNAEELNRLGFSTENIYPLSKLKPDVVANVLDNLVSLDFSDSQSKKLPTLAKTRSPRKPRLENKINSFATNVMLHGKNYVKFCIDKGQENIYKFDSDKMSLLQLGVNLTFPYNSGRACLPCGQKFDGDAQSLFEHLQKQEHLKNICELQVNDRDFEEFSEQFSDLSLAKQYMHASDESIQCHVCNLNVKDDDESIRQHIKDLVHKEKRKCWKEQSEQLFNDYLTIHKDIWYHAQVFFCEVCKKRCEFEIDFVMHLTHPEHIIKVYQLQHEGTFLTFDLCPSCITYLFGKTDSFEVHCQSNFHKRFAKNKDFMIPNLTITATEYLESIDTNIDLLIKESDKAILDKDNEVALLKAIVETVKPAYPDAKVYIFGSRLSDLGFPDSDVDVFLDCENTYYTSSSKEQSQQCIKTIETCFERTSNTWVVEEILIATRVPILKLRHIPTNLKCDISVTNGLSVEKSKLLGLYNRASPLCRKLILFMKKWLNLCRIFGSDYITTFAISWCVVFYLQLQGILPTVDELIKQKMKSKIVDGWECGFEEIVTSGTSNLSFQEHLKGFFTYFATFDYQKSVICPYLGKVIDKHTFAYTTELPQEMDLYKNRLDNEEIEIFRFDSPFCIQDPIDLSQNMTKAVKKLNLRCFRLYCLLSADKC